MKKHETDPVTPEPIVTPNPGQIFEEPATVDGETVTVADEPADAPAQPDS